MLFIKCLNERLVNTLSSIALHTDDTHAHTHNDSETMRIPQDNEIKRKIQLQAGIREASSRLNNPRT